MATLQLRRRTAAAPKAGGFGSQARQLKNNARIAEPYWYYDTRMFSAAVQPGDSAAVNFANYAATIGFFNGRTEGSTHVGITDAEDQNKTGADFLCTAIAIEVYCDTDAAGLTPGTATGVADAAAFVEMVVNYCAFSIWFGSKRKLVAPVSRFPAGGGPYQMVKTRSQAAAANAEGSCATNGMPTSQALRKLPEPILFKASENFRAQIDTPPTTLARIVALQALAGNFQAKISVILEGVRGTNLLSGVPA